MDTSKRSVLVTGVSHYWGSHLVPLLEADPDLDPIIGIDVKAPPKPFKRLQFFQISPHHPLLAELLKAAKVDTVCHLLFLDSYSYKEEYFNINIMGAMDLVAACAAGEVARLIVKSDTKVYGASFDNPALISEDTELRARYPQRYIQDRVEIEKFLAGFSKRHVSPNITVLRFANILCPTADTQTGRYLDSRFAPVALGYDPLLQFTHEQDVLAALYQTIKSEVTGPLNIAGAGVLPLSQVLKIGAKIPLPLVSPLLNPGARLLRRTGLISSIPLETDYLKFNCLGDTARMREELNFSPQYSARDTVREFFQYRRVRKYFPPEAHIEPDAGTDLLRQWIQCKRQEACEPTDIIENFKQESCHDSDQIEDLDG
ncbi:MAG: NAD-dependent epimerase/dehydratase family protein [Deltaproteobacteria bacterium]|nr:NAD-dependent epimerase/dehydratase family protein [Deltaproteobacteria bacterium]